ncbi:hypothetical protein N9948_01955 [bacterium]|nr:hypothetical protein [bacterium]
MLSKKHIDRMFIRQELTEDQARRADEIDKAAHEFALLIRNNIPLVNTTVEEALLEVKKAAMLARVAIATEDKDVY